MSPSPAAPTHCPYCALQCGMMVGRDDNGAWAVSPRDFPTNKGGLCRKGFTAASLLDSPERLKRPLLRREKRGALEPASWEEALDFVADKLIAIRAASGPDAIGVFGGGGLTNEKAYLLGKFARFSIGTANIDYNGRFCMASAAAAGLRAFGLDRGLPFPLEDIPEASVIIIFGSNPAETMPPIMQYFEEQRRRGASSSIPAARRRRRPPPTICKSPRARIRRSPTDCCTSRSNAASPTRRSSPSGPAASRRFGASSRATGRIASSA